MMSKPRRKTLVGEIISPHLGKSMIHETSLGLTLIILITISGQEITHLVHWAPALTVTLTACLSVVLAFLRAT